MRVIRNGMFMALLVLLGAVTAPAQSGEEPSKEEARATLREVLLEANVEGERVEATIRAMDERGWENVTPEGIGSILPALGYAKRDGSLPEDPRAFGEYARSLAQSGSELTRLGFTSREAARTITREVRRGRDRANARETPGASRWAERNQLRDKSRASKRGVARGRAVGPGIVPGVPERRPESPPGLDKPDRPDEHPEHPQQ